jgi:guanylate kinase
MTDSPAKPRRRGFVFILSSPSGAGKTTLARRLLEADSNFVLSVSATTRPARPGERDGVDYRFVGEAEFERMVSADEFLEYADVFGHRYGTPAPPVYQALEAGRDILFDIDWQGTQQVVQKIPSDVVSAFLLPPSVDELHRRLKARAQDSDTVVSRRMADAVREISHWTEYDYVLINDDIDACMADLVAIIEIERLRGLRQNWLVEFVGGLTADD